MSEFEDINPWKMLLGGVAVILAIEFLDSKWSFVGTNSVGGWLSGIIYLIAGLGAFASLLAIYERRKSSGSTYGENRTGPSPKAVPQDKRSHTFSDRPHDYEASPEASRHEEVKPTTSERLRRIERLYEEGLLTSEERDTKRREIMDDL